MTYTTSGTENELVKGLQSLDVDQQLALFYFIYKEMGDSITPAAPGASTASPEIGEAYFNQVKKLPHDQQLELQRDLINHKNTEFSREYGALSDTTKLLFWYLLAQGMDSQIIVPMPAGYELPSESQQLLEQIKGLDFDQQITLFRDYVGPMGVDPTVAEHDPETGL